jgi:hypothetical protein
MSRNKLLMAVATAALMAGTGGAFAQQEHGGGAAEKEKPAASSVTKPAAGAAQQLKSEQVPKSEASKPQSGRSQTTGQAPPSNSNQPAEHKAGEIKAQEKAGEKAVDKKAGQLTREPPTTGQNERTNRGDRERSTTGQATPAERRDTDRVNRNDRRDNAERDRNQGDRDRVQGERNENRTTITEGREGREGRSTTNVHVEFTSEQRTRIHEVIVRERSAPRVANVTFSLEIGTRVPRTVRLARLPSTIIEIEPEWRGYEYFLVGDDIVVVDPRRMEIVAVIPV